LISNSYFIIYLVFSERDVLFIFLLFLNLASIFPKDVLFSFAETIKEQLFYICIATIEFKYVCFKI